MRAVVGHWRQALLNSGGLYQTTLLFQHCPWSCKPGVRQDPSAGSTQPPLIHCPPSSSHLRFLGVETSHRESQDWLLHGSISGSGRFSVGDFRACLGWRILTFSPGPCSAYCPFRSMLPCFYHFPERFFNRHQSIMQNISILVYYFIFFY